VLTCRELIDWIDRYLAGELSAAETEAFRRHLEVCASCVRYLASYEAAVRLGKRAFECDPSDDLPADIPEDLIRAILASRSSG
jgi:anti-sigma factor RsiW